MRSSRTPPHQTKIVTRPDLPGWRVEWHAALGSTMDRARQLALSGAPTGTVVVADVQHQGRGTHGRSWIAPAGTCLMFTFVLRRTFEPRHLAVLPGRVAAIVRDVIRERYAIPVELKPPNDLLVDGRKLCGVLCLSQVSGERSPWALCGIGINTHLNRDQMQVEHSTSLLLEGADAICHEDLLAELLAGLDELRLP